MDKSLGIEIAEAMRTLDGPLNAGHMIAFIAGVRREKQLRQVIDVVEGGKNAFKKFMEPHEKNLVNPAIVPSLIALAINGLKDGPRYIENFVNGDAMIGLEDHVSNITIVSLSS